MSHKKTLLVLYTEIFNIYIILYILCILCKACAEHKVLLEAPQCGNKTVTWLVRELEQEIVCNYIFKTVAAKEVGKKKSFIS